MPPCCTAFPIWNQSAVPCPVLTVASRPAYKFLKRQVRWSDIPISFRIFQFIVIHTAKETLMYRTGLWTLWERERVGRFGRMALKHVKCHV